MISESMLGLALSMPADPNLKCPRTHHLPGFPREAPVVIVHGEIRGSLGDYQIDSLEPAEISRLEVMCWNPDTDGIKCVASQPGRAAAERECSATYSGARRALRGAWELGAEGFLTGMC